MSSPSHLLVAPIVLPLLTAALMLLAGRLRRRFNSVLNITSTAASLLVAIELLRDVDKSGVPEALGVYLAANWEPPFGIVLVVDRLSALMLVLTGVVGLGVAVYAAAAWSRAGVYFHPLFQLQLMGLHGSFLTGDLFNLFVFFEVMLAASYGLQLHGAGWERLHSGQNYIAVNLLASALFLIGLAVLYGVTGTLSMADVAAKLPLIAESDRGLLHASAAILAVAFLTKAAIWPLNFWLVPAYLATSAPVASLFALMTKVGIYVLLRVSTLLFSVSAGPSAHLEKRAFFYFGLATIAFGVLGLVGSVRLGRIAGFTVIVSSGTLLAAVGVGIVQVTAAALFYLLSATLSASALFLLVELIERAGRGDRIRLPEADLEPGEDTNLDDQEEALVGRVFPVSVALLGLAFIACALLVAGLPPLSGFVAKLALMTALLNPEGLGAVTDLAAPRGAWWLLGALLASGLATIIAMARAGIRYFWCAADRVPHLQLAEGGPVLAILFGCVWLTMRAEPVMRYTRAAAEALYAPTGYIEAVLSAKSVPGPKRPLGREKP